MAVLLLLADFEVPENPTYLERAVTRITKFTTATTDLSGIRRDVTEHLYAICKQRKPRSVCSTHLTAKMHGLTCLSWPVWHKGRLLALHIRISTARKKYSQRQVHHNKCAQRRLSSACASTQFDQRLRCLYEETLHHWLSKMRPVKILIRLPECAGRSEYSLGAHVRR